MTANPPLPVAGTVASAWRQLALRPRYVLRTGWIPALAVFGVRLGLGDGNAVGTDPGTAFLQMVAGILNFALLVLALVAWQRSALPRAKLRKGASALRLGRPELLAMVHFPLVGCLFVPLLLPALAENVVAVWRQGAVDQDVVLSAAAMLVLVFPGGLLLTRAALFLVALAEAGSRAVGLIATANRVWRLGAGRSIRLLLVLYLAVLPVIVAVAVLPDTLPVPAQAALRAVLLTLYVLVAGGALSRAYAALGGAAGRPAAA